MKIKVEKDIEKAKSIKEIVDSRLYFIKEVGKKSFPTIICENYYEVVKELATALFLCRGVKFIGEYAHKELIEGVVDLVGLDNSYLVFLDDLRMRRNGSLYYGEKFEDVYLKNNGDKIEFVIKKMLNVLDKELG